MHKSESYDSSKELYEPVESREKFKSVRFMEMALDFSTDMSDRNASRRLNRIRHEQVGISPQTYRNTVEREGKRIEASIKKKCDETLLENDFNLNGELNENIKFTPKPSERMELEPIMAAMETLNIKKCGPSDYESPESCVSISI